MKMESLQQRREELERKEYSLKEHLLKFDHFLKVKNLTDGILSLTYTCIYKIKYNLYKASLDLKISCERHNVTRLPNIILWMRRWLNFSRYEPLLDTSVFTGIIGLSFIEGSMTRLIAQAQDRLRCMFFNFIYKQENDAKRTRAMKKATEEKDLKRVKESEITK